MKSTGISPNNINTFFRKVNIFNRTIKNKDLTNKGFVTINSLEANYEPNNPEEK